VVSFSPFEIHTNCTHWFSGTGMGNMWNSDFS
jgi:hypothetical protein